jgi:DNA-binding NarL/FixJ family response regulator
VPSVVIVEDHLLVAEMLCAALADESIDAAIVAPAESAVLIDAVRSYDPLLVLLDLDLGEFGDSTGVIAPLTADGIRTVVVTGETDHERLAIAFEAGAFGLHAKSDGFPALVAKTTAALNSAQPLDEPVRRALGAELAELRRRRSVALRPFSRLTVRECATLRALSDGRTVSDIAEDWVVSEATVRSHVRGVLAKLEVSSQIGAVAMALRSGWLGSAT